MTLKVGILDTAPIAAAIRAAMPDLKEVGTASTFGALQQNTIRWPSAFVLPLAETPGQNRYINKYLLSQRVIARFGVIWAVRDIGDRKGSIANGEIRAVRLAGLAAVASFLPDDAESGCEPVSGKLISGVDRDGQMLWQDDFTVTLNRHIPLS